MQLFSARRFRPRPPSSGFGFSRGERLSAVGRGRKIISPESARLTFPKSNAHGSEIECARTEEDGALKKTFQRSFFATPYGRCPRRSLLKRLRIERVGRIRCETRRNLIRRCCMRFYWEIGPGYAL